MRKTLADGACQVFFLAVLSAAGSSGQRQGADEPKNSGSLLVATSPLHRFTSLFRAPRSRGAQTLVTPPRLCAGRRRSSAGAGCTIAPSFTLRTPTKGVLPVTPAIRFPADQVTPARTRRTRERSRQAGATELRWRVCHLAKQRPRRRWVGRLALGSLPLANREATRSADGLDSPVTTLSPHPTSLSVVFDPSLKRAPASVPEA